MDTTEKAHPSQSAPRRPTPKAVPIDTSDLGAPTQAPLSRPAMTPPPAALPAGGQAPLVRLDSGLLKDVRVTIQAKLGQVSISVQDLLTLNHGSVLTLDQRLNDAVELRLNDTVVARGEIVAVDDNFGVRITEVASRQ